MTAKWIASLSLVAALPLASTAPLAPLPATTVAVADEIVIEGTPQGLDVLDLMTLAQKVVGEPFLYDARDVKEARITLIGKISVARDRFLGVFERLLADADFCHLELRSGGGTVHRINKLGQQARGQSALKTLAPVVTGEDLMKLAERHTLVTTNYECKEIPAREATTTLNLYFADSATECVRNIEGTDQILMTGFSDNLAKFVGLLGTIDQKAAGSPRAAAMRELEQRLQAVEAQLAKLKQAAAPAK